MKIVYLDNAATTYPKPPEIVKAVSDSFKYVGNPGRGSHRLSEKPRRSSTIAANLSPGYFRQMQRM